MDTNDESAEWSVKKIFVGVLILGVIGWFAYQNRSLVLDYNNSTTRQVAGATTTRQGNTGKVAAPHIDLQAKVNEITQQVSNLDIKDVTSSSPQVQKVLHDMEALKNLPKSQAKDACMKICSGL